MWKVRKHEDLKEEELYSKGENWETVQIKVLNLNQIVYE